MAETTNMRVRGPREVYEDELAEKDKRIAELEAAFSSADDYSIALQRIIEALERGTPFTDDATRLAGHHLAMARRVRERIAEMEASSLTVRRLLWMKHGCPYSAIYALTAEDIERRLVAKSFTEPSMEGVTTRKCL